MTDPEFLSVDDVVFLHQEQLARFGGGDGVRDRAALVFLDLNGVEIDDPAGQLYGAMLNLAERRLTRERLAKLLRDLQERSK